jgi:hypothetical protein
MDKGVWLLEREKVVMRTIYILTDVIVIPADWIIDQVEPLDPLTLVRNLTISDGMEERFPDCFSQKKSFDVVENVSDFHNRYTVVTD